MCSVQVTLVQSYVPRFTVKSEISFPVVDNNTSYVLLLLADSTISYHTTRSFPVRENFGEIK